MYREAKCAVNRFPTRKNQKNQGLTGAFEAFGVARKVVPNERLVSAFSRTL
jgi:hypothetical protein